MMLLHFLPRSLVIPQLTPFSPQVRALCPTHNSGPHSPPSFRKHILCDFTIASNHNSQIQSPHLGFHLRTSSGAQEHLSGMHRHHKVSMPHKETTVIILITPTPSLG